MGKLYVFFVGSVLLAGATDTGASVTEPAVDNDEIVVTGFSKPYKLTGKQLATAIRVSRKYRPVYAPESALLFEVGARKKGRDLKDLRLSLRSGDKVIPLTLDAASRFTLPELLGKDWELVANRGSGGIRIDPLVLSPGSTKTDRSLGDMRVQCEVTWEAFARPQMPFMLRGVTAAISACRSKSFALYQTIDTRIAAATVTAGTMVMPVPLSATRMSYRYPGYDKALPNGARVRFRYD